MRQNKIIELPFRFNRNGSSRGAGSQSIHEHILMNAPFAALRRLVQSIATLLVRAERSGTDVSADLIEKSDAMRNGFRRSADVAINKTGLQIFLPVLLWVLATGYVALRTIRF